MNARFLRLKKSIDKNAKDGKFSLKKLKTSKGSNPKLIKNTRDGYFVQKISKINFIRFKS